MIYLVVGVDVRSWSVNCPHCMTIIVNWCVSCNSSRWIMVLIRRGLGSGPLDIDLLNCSIPSLKTQCWYCYTDHDKHTYSLGGGTSRKAWRKNPRRDAWNYCRCHQVCGTWQKTQNTPIFNKPYYWQINNQCTSCLASLVLIGQESKIEVERSSTLSRPYSTCCLVSMNM